MSKKIIDKVYIDGNVFVSSGIFWGKNFIVGVDRDSVQIEKIITTDEYKDNILEITDNYGSPYVEYYIRGGLTVGGGDHGNACGNTKLHDNLIERTTEQLYEVRELLNVSLPKKSLYPLFYREQHSATMSILENFLYCMVLREIIFDKDKLIHNIRSYDYKDDALNFRKYIEKSDDELFLVITEKASTIVYHKFWQVVLLYKIIFQKDIQPYIDQIADEVKKRNNIVHRNGRELNGEVMPIDKSEVETFINKVENIAKNIWDLIKLE